MKELKHTKDELERIQLYNLIYYSKTALEREAKHREAFNVAELEQAGLNTKIAEITLQRYREESRPHKMYQAETMEDPRTKKFICRLPLFNADGDEEEEERVDTVYAYGDTPAQATENFDHKWLYGNN